MMVMDWFMVLILIIALVGLLLFMGLWLHIPYGFTCVRGGWYVCLRPNVNNVPRFPASLRF